MKTYLDWIEPDTLRRRDFQNLSPWERIRQVYQWPYLIGLLTALLVLWFDPPDWTGRSLLTAIFFVISFGFMLWLLDFLMSLSETHVFVRDDHIGRQQALSYSRLAYKDLRDFRFQTVEIDNASIPILILETCDGENTTIELSNEVDADRLETTLIHCIRRRSISS